MPEGTAGSGTVEVAAAAARAVSAATAGMGEAAASDSVERIPEAALGAAVEEQVETEAAAMAVAAKALAALEEAVLVLGHRVVAV